MKPIILARMVVALVSVIPSERLPYRLAHRGIDSTPSRRAGQGPIYAPRSKAGDISQGKWWFQWYRWCYDLAPSDPSYEGSWYMEQGNWQWETRPTSVLSREPIQQLCG